MRVCFPDNFPFIASQLDAKHRDCVERFDELVRKMRRHNPILCAQHFLSLGFQVSTIYKPDHIYGIRHLNGFGARIVIRMHEDYIDITDFYCLSRTSCGSTLTSTIFFAPPIPNSGDNSLEDFMSDKTTHEELIFTSDGSTRFIEATDANFPPVHPGVDVLFAIKALKLTITQFSERTGLPEAEVTAVVEGREIPSDRFLETAFPDKPGFPEFLMVGRDDYCRSVGIKPPQP